MADTSGGLVVEGANEPDLLPVCALDRLVLGSDERGLFLAEQIAFGHCWVARIDGVLAGFIVMTCSFFKQPFIDLVIVHPECRRQGIGAALLRRCESACPSEKLFTSTNQSNLPMQRLLEAAEYSRCGYVEHLDEGDPELFYCKLLSTHAQAR